jgi:hypothetical protein
VAGKYPGQKGMVWLAAADGAGRQRLLGAATPVLAPSGGMIAVTQFGGGAGLGIFNVCGRLVGKYFEPSEAVSGIVWSSDSSLVAAIVDPHPKGSAFTQQLVVIDVATGKTTTVATGFLNGFGDPSFSPTQPYGIAYDNVRHAGGGQEVWSAPVDGKPTQLTHGGTNSDPLWGPQGILYDHELNSGTTDLELISDGRSTTVMPLQGWPVALSSDGRHLAAEGAACGVIWPLSVNLTTRKVVAKLANGFAPYGISPSGTSMLIAGSPPGANCSGHRSVIETVPFGGGKPTVIAYGADPSWADSEAVSVQAIR